MSRFDAARFREHCGDPLRLESHATLGSTIDRAWERLGDDPTPLVVVADRQESGRGRRGHAWHSPPGGGLYLALGLSASAERLPTRWTIAAGLAAAEACRAVGAAATIEWPNDVMVGRRKLGGVLVEARSGGARLRLVIGVGINLTLDDPPPEIAESAIALSDLVAPPTGVERLAGELVGLLLTAHDRLTAGEHAPIWRAWEALAPRALGCRVRVERGEGSALIGVTAGLDPAGALLVGERPVHLVDAVTYLE